MDARRWLHIGPEARTRQVACEMRRTVREEAMKFARNRGGIVFWNGDRSPALMRRPGKVRS